MISEGHAGMSLYEPGEWARKGKARVRPREKSV